MRTMKQLSDLLLFSLVMRSSTPVKQLVREFHTPGVSFGLSLLHTALSHTLSVKSVCETAQLTNSRVSHCE